MRVDALANVKVIRATRRMITQKPLLDLHRSRQAQHAQSLLGFTSVQNKDMPVWILCDRYCSTAPTLDVASPLVSIFQHKLVFAVWLKLDCSAFQALES
jgi:hypothetical protein